MSAFAAAVDLLFTDPNIGREAIYTSEGGAPMLVRVVSRRADAITGFGDDPRGKLHLFDGLKPLWRTLRIAKDPGCKACGSAAPAA